MDKPRISTRDILLNQIRHLTAYSEERQSFYHRLWIEKGYSLFDEWKVQPDKYVKYILEVVNPERLSLQSYYVSLKEGKRAFKPDNIELKRREKGLEDKIFLDRQGLKEKRTYGR